MTTTISCPLCFGPVTVHDDGSGACEVGHGFEAEELGRQVQARVDQALWAALRALEDEAAWGRTREREGRSVPPSAAQAVRDVEALRTFMRSRAQPDACI